MSIEKKYQKLSQIEHILKRPGMYIGAVQPRDELSWILKNNKMNQQIIRYSPGLYKLFDEILMNALDETTRDKTLENIKITIDPATGKITIFNDGKGIDVIMHKQYKMYVPELIFGHLLTSTTYEEGQDKVTAGTHGLGAKLTAIFSKYFEIEIGDAKNKKKFYQVYENNLSKKSTPKISNYTESTGYVKISFIPDYDYFKLKSLDKNHLKVMEKRVYDIAAISPENVSIFLNDKKINITNFNQYVNLYIGKDTPRVYEECGKRWKIVVCSSTDDKFQQVSFVNGINTSQGGKHVNYITNQISYKLYRYIQKKNKQLSIRESFVKDSLFVFISAVIENATFSSQTKEEMTANEKDFGSTCELSNKFYANLINKTNIVTNIISYAKSKEMRALASKEVKKKSTLKNIPKLDDANWAGTKKSNECILILTEGDSAKAMAVSGISAITHGRNIFGIFPLKGKLLNVREASAKQIAGNDEINNIKKILGLHMGKEYSNENIDELRYGKIMLMMDADVDGSHIKGLFFNFIHHFFPTLLKVDEFMASLITPVVKVTKGAEIISFNTLSKFEEWKAKVDSNKWAIKYYKGLGTNTSKEARSYFDKLTDNMVYYKWDGTNSNESLELAFSKKLADNRKRWLKNYDKNLIIERSQKLITYHDFIHKDLIHFSNYDNIRSIPHLLDGFKPSHRKVLFGSFKKNLITDVKVAQIVGYISEQSAYHHGEMSLTNTIIGMAQNFVGSNNLNLLVPSGQFGTRLLGGKDHSSARYIFTRLNKITRHLFPPSDDYVLNYIEDDGMKVEPIHYIPILPLILINGTEGIGTGYSTSIPKFNMIDIMNNIREKLEASQKSNELKIGEWRRFKPYYNGFTGDIIQVDKDSYISKGKYIVTGDKIEIIELPIGLWSSDYKNYLENLIYNLKKSVFKSLQNHCTESKVHFVMKIVNKEMFKKLLQPINKYMNGIDKLFKLVRSINLTNMYLYNSEGILTKYKTVYEILDEYYLVRLRFYKIRKEFLINKLKTELNILGSKVKFISSILSKKLDISNKTREDVVKILKNNKYYIIKDELEYDYLLKMPFYSLTKQRVIELNTSYKKKKEEYEILDKKTEKQLWIDDLKVLEKVMNQSNSK